MLIKLKAKGFSEIGISYLLYVSPISEIKTSLAGKKTFAGKIW